MEPCILDTLWRLRRMRATDDIRRVADLDEAVEAMWAGHKAHALGKLAATGEDPAREAAAVPRAVLDTRTTLPDRAGRRRAEKERAG